MSSADTSETSTAIGQNAVDARRCQELIEEARQRALLAVQELWPNAEPEIAIFDGRAFGFVSASPGRRIVHYEIVGDWIIVASITREERLAARAAWKARAA